jgi:AraC-like DNA-binding protein
LTFMMISALASLVPKEVMDGPGLVRYLSHPGGEGRLTMMSGQHDGSTWQRRAWRNVGSAQLTLVRGWYGLSLCLTGHGWLSSRRGPLEVRAGSLLRFTNRPHGEVWHRVEGLSELVLCLDASTGAALGELGFWPSGDAVVHDSASAELVRSFLRLRRDADDPASAPAEIMRRLIDHLMLAWSTMDTAGDAAFTAKARQLLAEDIVVGPSVAATARKLGLSERQFRRRFTRAAGLSPQVYRRQLRMERACQLLATLPVAEVAARLGYADPSVFSRQFSSAMGLAPSSLRRGK